MESKKIWFAGAYRTPEGIEKRRAQQRASWAQRKEQNNKQKKEAYELNRSAINARKRREYRLRKILGPIGHDEKKLRSGDLSIADVCRRVNDAHENLTRFCTDTYKRYSQEHVTNA